MAKGMLNRKQWSRIVTIALSTLTGVTTVGAVASAETFVVSNSTKALNTNRNFRLIDGHPRMSLWTNNINDADQHFDRLQGNRGGQLLRHRSTGKCLNAYRRWNGAEVNVYPCNADDPDQNFNVENLTNGDVQIRLSEIRNNLRFCIDSPTRNDGGAVTIWQCNSGGNQRFKINGNNTPPVVPDNGNVVVRPSIINRTFGRGAEFITPNRYKFAFQQDGNLVLYTPQGRAIWATGTNGTAANMLALQTDGNVVLYANSKPVWATDTAGNPGAYLAIQTDGNVVVYTSNNVPIFNTGTVGGVTRTFTASADWLRKSSRNQVLTLAQFNNWRTMPEFTTRNPFPSKGKNCTWYAYGRMLMLGFKQSALDTMLGNAGTWDNTAKNGAFVSSTPQVGSIVVWEAGVSGAGRVGHVGVVEKVNSDNTILISESNWNGQPYSTRTISRYAPSKFVIVPR